MQPPDRCGAARVAIVGAVAAALVATAGASRTVAGTEEAQAQARPPVDAPELARLGDDPIGVARIDFVQPAQLDPLQGSSAPAVADRRLPLTIWYPADKAGGGTTYHTALSGQDGRDVAFDLPGLATPDAAPLRKRHPLVILAHGYGNTPEVLSWLAENLASKGYFVVAPAFRDPPISLRTAAAFAGPLSRRPLDVAFVAREVRRRAQEGHGLFVLADVSRTALIGYSMGGYGVLTAAGAPLSPLLGPATRGVLGAYAADGTRAAELKVPDVKAVVAISPAARFADTNAWAAPGVGAVKAPALFIVGSQDRSVGYDPVRALYETPAPAPRYLLTFREAGHGIALVGAPPAMRRTFWDEDWFEDAVWRKDRLLPIQAHFITAFLDRYVKGDVTKAGYLDGLVEDSDTGRWPGAPAGRVAAYSPGPPASSVWKGFQPGRAAGMNFEMSPAR